MSDRQSYSAWPQKSNITTTDEITLTQNMILTWQKLGFLLAIVLLYALHWTGSSRETLLPGGDNYSRASLEMCRLDFTHCYSICWLLCQLTPCPFMSLLLLGLIAGSFYYALFLACGYAVCPRQRHEIQITQISHKWRLRRRASSTADCSLMEIQLEGATGTTHAALEPPPVQPKPPPRRKKLQAPKPPAPNPHPSQEFGSTLALQCFTEEPNPDLYRNLRQNLQRALDGLQKPLPTPIPLPLPVPLPVAPPLSPTLPQLDEPLSMSQSGYPASQEKMKSSPKLLSGILNRFGVTSKKSQRDKGSSSSSLFRPLWQRLRSRSSRKIAADIPLSTSSSTCSSRSVSECRFMCPNEVSQRTAWKSSYA